MRTLRRALEVLGTTQGVLFLLMAAFTCVYAIFYATSGGVYHSPDEQAVAVFSRSFSESRSLRLSMPVSSDVVLPRSVNISGNDYVPGSFIALPLLLGYSRALFGKAGYFLLIPLIAAAAPVFFFVLLKPLFGRNVAWASALLLWLSPAWIYFASRAFLPNVLFTSCLIISLGMWRLGKETSRPRLMPWYSLAAGLVCGLSLAIRPVEAVWALPLALAYMAMTRRPARQWLYFVLGFAAPLLFVAYWQEQTYGAWYRTGYDSLSEAAPSGAAAAGHILSRAAGALFPFGFQPWQSLLRFVEYQWRLYWWQLPWLILGVGTIIQSARKNPAHKKYALAFALVCAYIIVYYGSWSISDHPDPDWVSIGVAYNRYWLPAFVLAIPVLVLGLQRLRYRVAALAAMIACSVVMVFAWGADSLWALHANGVKYQRSREQLVQDLPHGSIVLTDREDKWLWPTFSVIKQDGEDLDVVSKLPAEARQSMYWMTALPDSHARELEQRVFAPQHFSLQYVGAYQDWSVYHIISDSK